MSAVTENIYDMILISKIKERTGPKKLKNIMKNLRNFAEDDIKEFPGLKFKKLEEKKEDEKELRSKNSLHNDAGNDGENTSATNDNEEEVKQFDNSGFSANE